MNCLDARARTTDQPFRHVAIVPVVEEQTAGAILDHLDAAVWRPVEGRSYAFERLAAPAAIATIEAILRASVRFQTIQAIAEDAFKLRLRPGPVLDIHRYAHDAGIGFHTDDSTDDVRLVVNLNRGWQADRGGFWVLSSEPRLDAGSIVIPSLNNAAFCFRPASNTYHALTDVDLQVSYALVARYRVED